MPNTFITFFWRYESVLQGDRVIVASESLCRQAKKINFALCQGRSQTSTSKTAKSSSQCYPVISSIIEYADVLGIRVITYATLAGVSLISCRAWSDFVKFVIWSTLVISVAQLKCKLYFYIIFIFLRCIRRLLFTDFNDLFYKIM